MGGFIIAMILVQLMFWTFSLLMSTPKSGEDLGFQTTKEIRDWFLYCFIPFLPLIILIVNRIKKFK